MPAVSCRVRPPAASASVWAAAVDFRGRGGASPSSTATPCGPRHGSLSKGRPAGARRDGARGGGRRLEALRGRGFVDERTNMGLLRHFHGRVELCVAQLLGEG